MKTYADLNSKLNGAPWRKRTCLDCNHKWSAACKLTPHTANLSGEQSQWCPKCGTKNVMSGPHYFPRKREKLIVANNTTLRRDGDDLIIRLHNTDILIFTPDGRVEFQTDGWKTVTTKARMNEFSPVSIGSERGVWTARVGNFRYHYEDAQGNVVADYTDGAKFVRDPFAGAEAVFADGIIWNPNTSQFEGNIGEDPKAVSKLVMRIKKFVDEYMTAFMENKVPAPGPGDCWVCSVFDKLPVSNPDHLLSHMKENYFVPSLLMNAIARFPVAPVAKWAIADHWATQNTDGSKHVFEKIGGAGSYRDIGYKQLHKSLYRYMKERLGVAA